MSLIEVLPARHSVAVASSCSALTVSGLTCDVCGGDSPPVESQKPSSIGPNGKGISDLYSQWKAYMNSIDRQAQQLNTREIRDLDAAVTGFSLAK